MTIPLDTQVRIKSHGKWLYGIIRHYSDRDGYRVEITSRGWIQVDEDRIEVVKQMELR